VEASENDGWVEIRVRDHGSGVPEDFIPRMWEKFARPNDSSDREKVRGSAFRSWPDWPGPTEGRPGTSPTTLEGPASAYDFRGAFGAN
jgi:signal transduction histidine kinase